MEIKKRAQQLSLPSAGCVFKNPSGCELSAARLIELSNLKGARCGDAQICVKHANFIVNPGKAKAEDVLNLIELVQKKVKDDHNITLELEIKIVGE